MRRTVLLVLLGVAVVAAVLLVQREILPHTPKLAKPPAYVAPEETATLAPGPNVDIAEATCSACHSLDYITTQPRSFPDQKAFWTAEVAKMRSTYKLDTTDENAAKIVDYLAATYR